jgi:hypothetical protein
LPGRTIFRRRPSRNQSPMVSLLDGCGIAACWKSSTGKSGDDNRGYYTTRRVATVRYAPTALHF